MTTPVPKYDDKSMIFDKTNDIESFYGMYVRLDSDQLVGCVDNVNAKHKAEVCINIDGKKFEFTFAEFKARIIESDVSLGIHHWITPEKTDDNIDTKAVTTATNTMNQAADMIKSLAAQLASAREEIDRQRSVALDVSEEMHRWIDKRDTEIARLKADAERYQWLRSHCVTQSRNGPGVYWYLPRHGSGTWQEQLDTTIDAAIAASKEGEK